MIISFVNTKGGVGRSTSCLNIGVGLHRLEKRILLIDIDSSSMLTNSLGIESNKLKKTIANVLEEEATLEDVIIKLKENLFLIPSSFELANTERRLSSEYGSEVILKKALESINGFDYILIDTSPGLNILNINALTSSNEILIPLQPTYSSLQCLSDLIKKIEKIKKRLNKNLEITGIFLTRYDSRRNLDKQVRNSIKNHFGSLLFSTVIRENVSIKEAPSYGLSIYDYKKSSHGSIDYNNLCREILKRS